MNYLKSALKLFICFLIFTGNIHISFANDDKQESLLKELAGVYKQRYGTTPGNISVERTDINGVTTYHSSVSRCDSNNDNCKIVFQKTFRESAAFVEVDGQFYSAVSIDSYKERKPLIAQNQRQQPPDSKPERVDFIAGYKASSPGPRSSFDEMLQSRYAPTPLEKSDLEKFLPAIAGPAVNSYNELQRAIQTSTMLHDAHVNNLKALDNYRQDLERSSQNRLTEAKNTNALSALNLALLSAELGRYQTSAEKAEELRQLEKIKQDPFSFKQYELTAIAEQDLYKQTQESAKKGDLRSLAKLGEIGFSQVDPNKVAQFQEKFKNVYKDGIIRIESVIARSGAGPLESRIFATSSQTPTGQALRRVANKAQVYWAEQNGYKNATSQSKAIYLTALTTLSSAESEFRQGQFQRGYAKLDFAQYLLHGSIGFIKGIYKSAEGLVTSVPEMAELATSLAKSIANDPSRIVTDAFYFTLLAPEMIATIDLALLEELSNKIGHAAVDYTVKFMNSDAEYQGEILGRIAGEVILATASGGQIQAVTKSARMNQLATKASLQLSRVADITKSSELGGMIAENISAIGFKAHTINQKMRVAVETLGINTPQKFRSLLSSFAKSGSNSVYTVDEVVRAIVKSPFAKEAFDHTPLNRPSIYIRPSGEAIPATAYRYYSANDTHKIKYILTEGHIPVSAPFDTYVTFNKFENATEAAKKLQLPSRNGRFRVTFDTLDTLEDLRVPRGKYGEADWLEPFTKDYQDYGQGGATQAVTNKKITAILEIKDLESGKVLFRK